MSNEDYVADDEDLFLKIISRLAKGGFCKYVHPEMEVEFLIPEQGRGAGGSISVEALRVEA